MDTLFAIARQKVQLKLQAVTAKTCHNEEESLARITVICTPTNVATQAGLPQTERKDEEGLISEICLIILFISGCYPGLPKAKIIQIDVNHQKSENLDKFCHLKGRENKNRDENIVFHHSQMKIKKVTGILRNFGNTIDIWLNGFLNYSMIMVDFLEISFFSLFQALLNYHSKICHLSQIYNWQHTVLFLAINYPSKITTEIFTNVQAWVLSQQWIDQYCSLLWFLYNLSTGSHKHAATSTLDNPNRNKQHNGNICRDFNIKGCLYKECP